MCEVEAVINGRPIRKVSEDSRDLEALSPNRLLLLRQGAVLPLGLFQREDNYSRRRWRQIQYLADQFWKRRSKEYIPLLQRRQKWNNLRRNLAVGDIVLVADENTPRTCWPLPGSDGFVQRVKVKAKTTVPERPVAKCVLLEATEENEH